MRKQKQILYKPKKEKVEPVPKPEPVTFEQVTDYFANYLWEHRGFILTAALLITWTYMLVRS